MTAIKPFLHDEFSLTEYLVETLSEIDSFPNSSPYLVLILCERLDIVNSFVSPEGAARASSIPQKTEILPFVFILDKLHK